MDDVVCNVCDGTEFSVTAGFYYCDNCGNRITVLQEIEDNTDGINPFDETIQVRSHRIKQPPKSEKTTELTTYETFNYILYGLVNELVCLGCKEELIITTLQMYSAYLHAHEIAFFGKRETKLPKMPFKYKLRDVHIIYNLPTKKRRASSASSGSRSVKSGSRLSLRQVKLAMTKTRQSLASAQYQEYMSSQKSDISSVGYNSSQPSSTAASEEASAASIRIEYSRRARRQAKSRMTRDHLLEHQRDIAKALKCHKKYLENDNIGRPFVYALLWLALNHIGDDLQLGDMIRYTKESHIKLNNISTFLPPNADINHAVNHFRRSSRDNLQHFALRRKAFAIAQTIELRHIKLPDLSKLSARYTRELCLPSIVAEMIDKLLAFYPPQMKMNKTFPAAMPNYEGRAMAYILFVMKLFFGLDDEREQKISEAGQVLNGKLEQLELKHKPLFVWTEWVDYIEMRNSILSQCHYPTAMHIDPNAKIPVDLYIDFLRHANEDSMCSEKFRKKEMENIGVVFEQVMKLHKDVDRPSSSMQFPASLTPFVSYLSHIINTESIRSQIFIPDFMNVNHETRDMAAFLKPINLRRAFEEAGHKLDVYQIGQSANIEFVPITFDNQRVMENVRFCFDISTDEWLRSIGQRDAKREAENVERHRKFNKEARDSVDVHLQKLRTKEANTARIKKFSVNSTANQHQTTKSAVDSSDVVSVSISDIPSYKYFDEDEKGIVDEFILNEPRRNLDQPPTILDYGSSEESDLSSDEESPLSSILDENRIEFIINNYDYWIALENVYYLTNKSFDEKSKYFPKSFKWLLKQCALHLHQHPRDLYIELMAIENVYRFVLKPTFKMDNCFKFREQSKLTGNLGGAVEWLRRIW